jgi:tetratricopeptide (TPR) repeat protein
MQPYRAPRGRRARLALLALLALPVPLAAQPEPDALYRDRVNLASARQAVEIWEGRLKANPVDFEAAWKIARATYWIGKHEPRDAGRRTLERGVAVGRQAAAMQPGRPEGYFWMAASMGALAESFGLLEGLRYRGAIKDALERVLKIDPAYLDGSADRALGRWYHQVPGLFGGSESKSEEHLRTSLTYNPDSILSRFFLAETLFERNKSAEALDELRKVIAATPDPEFEPEDREIQQEAAEELARRTKGRQ